MTQPWQADIEIDPALAASLISSQFPELTPVRCAPFGMGWDNAVFAVNDEWLFRFPRRTIAVELIHTEMRVLPRIADRLTLPIPVPQFVGEGRPEFPWPFFGYRPIRGRTACDAALDRNGRIRSSRDLGAFLRGLHSIPIESIASPGVPPDTWGRLDPQKRVPQAHSYLERGMSHGLIDDPEAILRIIEESAAPLAGQRTLALVHGDLYSKHLLIDEGGRACGVIDWGDVHQGDAAVDLAIAWSWLPREGRASFRLAYGPIDEATWARARFRALYHALITVVYGEENVDAALRDESRVALRNVADA